MLFHLLNDYSIDLWKQQIELIMEKAGLISFIAHPDYIRKPRELAIYKELLAHLADLRIEAERADNDPGEVDHWWRQRAAMTLVEDGEGLRIEGAGSERARLAYASEKRRPSYFHTETSGPCWSARCAVRTSRYIAGVLSWWASTMSHPLSSGVWLNEYWRNACLESGPGIAPVLPANQVLRCPSVGT